MVCIFFVHALLIVAFEHQYLVGVFSKGLSTMSSELIVLIEKLFLPHAQARHESARLHYARLRRLRLRRALPFHTAATTATAAVVPAVVSIAGTSGTGKVVGEPVTLPEMALACAGDGLSVEWKQQRRSPSRAFRPLGRGRRH